MPIEGLVITPKIRIHGTSEVFEGALTTSILNVLLRNGFPIQTVCGGKVECGRDIIRIRSGQKYFSPPKEREMKLLALLAARGEPSGPDVRLACQSYIYGDVEIEVLHQTVKRKSNGPGPADAGPASKTTKA